MRASSSRSTLPLRSSPTGRDAVRPRRGVALILTMILTVAFAALAMGAIYLTGNAALIGSSYDRERDYRYGAEAALGIAKSQLNGGLFVLPDSLYSTIMNGATITGADGLPLSRVLVNLYVGPTGSTSGQDGTFGSIVAEATDGSGARYVRRLELTQETFAKFAYFSVNEKLPGGALIVFGGGDVIFGPLFSNDTIQIASGSCPQAAFRDQVQTAQIIVNPSCATFSAYGYQQNVLPIALPTNAKLAVLNTYASPANFLFTPRPANPRINQPVAFYPYADTSFLVQTRIEFVNHDLDNDGSFAEPQDGFFRVYETLLAPMTAVLGVTADSLVPINYSDPGTWVRGDPPSNWAGPQGGTTNNYATRWDTTNKRRVNNCGDWHTTGLGASRMPRFFPFALHRPSVAWFNTILTTAAGAGGPGMSAANATTHLNQNVATLMTNAVGAVGSNNEGVQRCYLGGAPQLVAIERYLVGGYAAAAYQKGGDDTTFTPIGRWGQWKTYAGTIDGRLTSGAARRADASYLFPLYRGINTFSRGVIQVNGSVGVSGTLRGRVTLYSNGGNVVVLDNMRYAISPSNPDCLGERDILGIISGKNTTIANNALLDPQFPTSGTWSAAGWKSYNPGPPGTNPISAATVGITLHGVVMTLDAMFRVEGRRGGSMSANPLALCGAALAGRGCLNLTGGILMDTRGAVAYNSASGFTKRYAYDRCAASRPPPYFPTTGRFVDNRFYEIDPVKFNRMGVAAYFEGLAAGP